MIKVVEKTARTEDEAINLAVAELGVSLSECRVEVLEKSRSGFLGIGSAPAKVRVSCEIEDPVDVKVAAFLEGLLERMDVKAQANVTLAEDGSVSVELVGSEIGALIGRRGETLDAIQHLANYSINRGDGQRVRISIDAENYRAKREESLVKLAKKVADKVLRYRKSMTLEPMNAYERHIIHTALQEVAGVTTYSTGSEPNRRIVVAYDAANAPARSERPQRERGYGRGRGNDRRRYAPKQAAPVTYDEEEETEDNEDVTPAVIADIEESRPAAREWC